MIECVFRILGLLLQQGHAWCMAVAERGDGRAGWPDTAGMAGLRGTSVLPVLLLAASLAAVHPGRADADTIIERGDVLSVSVLEDTSLGREAKVNVDGQIVLPQLGGIEAAGSDLAGIRARIEEQLRRNDIILKPTVIVDVVQYRPFYVGGAVARPGAFPFEPGLTVRHALVLAGGLARSGGSDLPTIEDLDELKLRFQTATFSLRQVDSLIARLTAELARDGLPSPTTPSGAGGTSAEADRVQSIDADILKNRIGEWTAEQAKLRDMVELLGHEVDILAQQSALMQTEREVQLAEVESTRALYEKGLVPLPRLQDAQREASAMARDLLETEAFQARALQNKAAAEHDLAVADTVWQIEAQRNLRDAELQRAELKAELAALRARMRSVGLTVQDDGSPVKPTQIVVIHRQTSGVSETLDAGMDSEVRPGDVIDVTLEVRTDG